MLCSSSSSESFLSFAYAKDTAACELPVGRPLCLSTLEPPRTSCREGGSGAKYPCFLMDSFKLLYSAHHPTSSCCHFLSNSYLQATWRGQAAEGGCSREMGRAFSSCSWCEGQGHWTEIYRVVNLLSLFSLCEFNASRNCLRRLIYELADEAAEGRAEPCK